MRVGHLARTTPQGKSAIVPIGIGTVALSLEAGGAQGAGALAQAA